MDNRRKLKKGPRQTSYFTTQSVAYEFQPAYDPQYPNAPVNPKKKKTRKVSRTDRKEKRYNFFYKIRLFFAVFIVFLGCLLTMCSYAAVTRQKMQISEMREELAALQSDNRAMEAEISEQIDLTDIKRQAMTRLGMKEPQSYQIVYIDVPKQSYTVSYDENIEEETSTNEWTSFWKKAVDMLKKDGWL